MEQRSSIKDKSEERNKKGREKKNKKGKKSASLLIGQRWKK